MADRITAEQFTEADGVADWSATGESAEATFRTGSFAAGVALIERIGVLADGANHHPDVDLRYATVTVRLTTHDAGGLTTKDLALARDVSDAARGLGIAAEAH